MENLFYDKNRREKHEKTRKIISKCIVISMVLIFLIFLIWGICIRINYKNIVAYEIESTNEGFNSMVVVVKANVDLINISVRADFYDKDGKHVSQTLVFKEDLKKGKTYTFTFNHNIINRYRVDSHKLVVDYTIKFPGFFKSCTK